ncbi:uncharacterized protein LOC143298981 isoform X2 [Babylonia areolata]
MATEQHMMTSAVVLLVALALGNVSPVSAWFIGAKNMARANGKEVDDRCEAHGQAGDCEFYSCFEQRLSCGASGFMLDVGLPYCQSFQQALPTFTKEGQVFINNSNECLTKRLLPYYRQDQVDCHRLSHAAFKVIGSCYTAHDFCTVWKSNKGAFTFVFEPRHLFQKGALKIWREILGLTYRCNPEQVQSFVRNIASVFWSGISGLFSSSEN